MSDHLKELLRWAIEYVATNNTRIADRHMHARSRQIEPGSVRNEVQAANHWLERAKRAVK